MDQDIERRHFLRLGSMGAALAGAATLTSASLKTEQAYAQAASTSLLRTVLDRGKLIVGTGSTNAPWHFENDKGELVGMDITMARILAKGLFDDESKVEFVQEDPAQRIPNITTGKVDIVVQFMTISAARAQLINFTRPYYVEGIALLTRPDGRQTPMGCDTACRHRRRCGLWLARGRRRPVQLAGDLGGGRQSER